MKKLLYLMCFVGILASCKEEPAPEPLVVTMDELNGTWVYENAESGVAEVLKFTEKGGFYYTTTLAHADFEGYKAGNYAVIDDVTLNAVVRDKTLDYTITKMSAYSFTARDNASGVSTTYAKLIEIKSLDYKEVYTPGYTSLVTEQIKSFKSRNEKTATVDALGTITAQSEGWTLIDVETMAEGTAVVLIKAIGLIPDYTKLLGMTKDEAVHLYGDLGYSYEDPSARYEVKLKVSKRTNLVNKVVVEYEKKPFANSALVEYLETKYYVLKEETSTAMRTYTDKATYDKSVAKITWNNVDELEYTSIDHDLFEDFSIALGKSREEIEEMYGNDQLELLQDRGNKIEYLIGDEILGYTGVELMDEVAFTFNNENRVNLVELKLYKTVKSAEVYTFLTNKYLLNSEKTTEKRIYFYDAAGLMEVTYIVADNTIEYSNDL